MRDRHITSEQVAEIGRVQRLKPKESDLIGKRGYRREYREDGSYEWRYRFKTNDRGRPTKQALEVGEMMRPFQVADAERHLKNQAREERVALRDRDGHSHFLDPALADQTARQNGWSHRWRARGAAVECGTGGMMWRRARTGWEPLGVRCFGTPLFGGSARVSRRGLQWDPDGAPWRWNGTQWVEV